MATALEPFREMYEFGLDPFQIEACQALEAGKGVLVAAPTGSGKTIVGEFAVHLALEQGRKCFYTTPIKALSNQKFADLVKRYGADKVGLLTGDNSVNSEAPVVVMTTEVLRNMLYAGSQSLSGLGYVVMDEAHYLSDRFRGAVWEEVIIHLPESVHPRTGSRGDEHDRPDLRPDRRAPDRVGLPPGQRGHGERATGWPGCTGSWICSPASVCGTGSGKGSTPPNSPRVSWRWSTRRGRPMTRSRPSCRPGPRSSPWARWCGSGAAGRAGGGLQDQPDGGGRAA
ncbi:hypothetical protein SMICM304S_08948 [Streptomyces microflavus]